MKICHITTAHPPFDIRIYQKECRSLAQAGFEVFLLARNHENQKADGVQMVLLPNRKGHLGRIRSALLDVPALALGTGAELFHFHDPEIIPTGVLLKLLGKKVIYDVHEDFGAAAHSRDWIPGPVKKVISTLFRVAEKTGCLFFDAAVAATASIAGNLPCRKTVLVQNFPLKNELVGVRGDGNSASKYVVYVGACSEDRGMKRMVEALGLLPQELQLSLKVAGVVSPALKDSVSSLPGWKRVELLGYMGRKEVGELLNSAMAGLVLFQPTPNHIHSQPNKLFEYMSAGLPIIVSDFPLWKNLIESTGCGVCVDPLDPAALAAAMKDLLAEPEKAREMGRRGRKAVEEKYNWEAEAPKLTALCRKLTEQTAK